MTVVPLPGLGGAPEPSRHSRRDDGGWHLERAPWTDYPPHFTDWRPGQWEAVEQAVEAFRSGARTVLLDGPTGCGKTFVANGVRAEMHLTTTYSCHSLNLQEQWCVAPETRVLTADLEWIPAEKVGVGMALMGFDEEPTPNRRLWRQAEVLATRTLVQPCYELTLEDGTVLTSSATHRWLAYRGKARPHWITTENIRPASPCSHCGEGAHWQNSTRLVQLLSVWETDTGRDAGYLAAAFDGEGHLAQGNANKHLVSGEAQFGAAVSLCFSQRDNAMLAEVRRCLDALRFPWVESLENMASKLGTCQIHRIRVAGRAEVFRFLGSVRPARLLEKFDPDRMGMIGGRGAEALKMGPAAGLRVVEKRYLGEQVVIGITTSTGTFVAEGIASHNSRDFAPYPILMGRSNYPIKWPGTPRFVTAADCTWNAREPDAGCQWCPEKAVCPYETAKRRALAAPFRCVNHAYLVTESRHIGRFTHPLLILDEAEMVEHAILGQVSVTFPARLRTELDLGQPRFVTKEESIKEWLADVVVPALARDLRRYPRDSTDRRTVRAREAADNRLAQTLFVLNSYDDGWVFDRGSDTWALRPVWASHWGHKWIGERADHVLAMSATLISGTQVAMDLGLPEPHVTIRVEGGFDPALRPVYLAPLADLRSVGEDGGPKRIPDHQYDRLAIAVRGVMARHPRDRVLVHCHSFKVARELYQRLDSPRVYMYEGGGRDEALKVYLATPGAVLLAPSLERGVDLADDDCRVVLWVKVPFPFLGDPVVKKRRYSGGPAGSRWYAVETIRAIVQGCGRAVRHFGDYAEIYLLDAAFMSLWRKERRLFPAWFADAIRFDFDSRKLMRDGERVSRIQAMARAAGRDAGRIESPRRAPITGSRPRAPDRVLTMTDPHADQFSTTQGGDEQ